MERCDNVKQRGRKCYASIRCWISWEKEKKKQQSKQPLKFVEGSSILRLNFD